VAIIDRYLEAMTRQQADAVVFVTDKPVELHVSGQVRSVSSRPTSQDQILSLTSEVAGADFESRLTDGIGIFPYESPWGAVSVTVQRDSGGLAVKIQPTPGTGPATLPPRTTTGEMGPVSIRTTAPAMSPVADPRKAPPVPVQVGNRGPISSPGAARLKTPTSLPGTPRNRDVTGTPTAPAEGGPRSIPPPPRTPPILERIGPPTAQAVIQTERAEPILPGHLDELFDAMVDMRASDLHLKAGKMPMIRVDGNMVPLPNRPVLPPKLLTQLILEVMPERNGHEFHESNDTDFAYETKRARIRCNIFRDMAGIGACFRLVPWQIMTAQELNLPPAVMNFCEATKGLVLVTGPTGSGKSTTLAAMVDWVNEHRDSHLITIEDPIEFVHKDKRCHINQREIGTQTRSFKSALRAALREDPDIVMVGEMRDLETVAIAIETAETGHLVFGTLHTNTAASTVDRLIDQFPAERQGQVRSMLAESLRGVVSQTLVRKKEGGRVAAMEVLVVNSAVANMIREGKTFQIASAMQTGRTHGMQTINDALLDLVRAGIVDPAEAFARSPGKRELGLAMSRAGIQGSWDEG
jgi:twitching motility protein PilT